MFIIVVAYNEGAMQYIGPFPSVNRAQEYIATYKFEYTIYTWSIVPLTTPLN